MRQDGRDRGRGHWIRAWYRMWDEQEADGGKEPAPTGLDPHSSPNHHHHLSPGLDFIRSKLFQAHGRPANTHTHTYLRIIHTPVVLAMCQDVF